MTCLILVRHGNTFAPGDKVVWAGARTDLPLVATGRAQAEQLGQTLAAATVKPDRILAGPLIRTRQHSQIIAKLIGFSSDIEIENALCEIDYGAWEGCSTEDIHALGGKTELDAWDKAAQWPNTPGWTPSCKAIKENVFSLLKKLGADHKTQTAILFTSNGILRFFANAAVNPPDKLKVQTGHVCQMILEESQWQQISWNRPPDEPFANIS
jgi:probable phosphoglycerate mutase